jgi:hypothetical protein
VTRRELPKHADCASRHGGEDSKLSGRPPSAIQPFKIFQSDCYCKIVSRQFFVGFVFSRK